MPEAIVHAAAPTAAWLLTYLLHSTVLLLGVWALSRGAGLGPATRDLLWKTAMLGSLFTSLIATRDAPPRGRMMVMQVSAVERIGTRATSVESTVIGWDRATRGGEAGIRAGAGGLGAPGAEFGQLIERASTRSAGTAWRWYAALVLVWLAGALWGLVRLQRQWAGLRVVAAALKEPSDRMVRLFAVVLADEGSALRRDRPIRLRSSDAVDSPCALPGRVIVLPSRCDAELSDEEVMAVLAHELGHLRRRDPLWAALMGGVAAMFWLQPMNRVARRAAQQAAEHACDDFAVTTTGAPLGLAASITRVARWGVDARTPVAAVAMVGRRGRGMVDRVGRILGGGPRRAEPRWARVLLAALLLLPLRWLPVIEPPPFLRAAFVSERLIVERTGDGSVVGPPELHVMSVRSVTTGGSGGG